MFAYCLNTPVNGCDPCGSCFHRWDIWNDCEKCGGKTVKDKWEKLKSWCANTAENVVNYVTNNDVNTARNNLKHEGFSFYKGAPVFRSDALGLSAFSFGVIVMGSDNLGDDSFGDTLNHEYGHFVHMNQIGPSAYLTTTAIPSLIGAGLSYISPTVNKYYYDLPWERTADYLGGVNRGYLPYSNTVGTAFWLYTLIASALQ